MAAMVVFRVLPFALQLIFFQQNNTNNIHRTINNIVVYFLIPDIPPHILPFNNQDLESQAKSRVLYQYPAFVF